MIEVILVPIIALILDFTFGDPKNKYHPTAWVGRLVAKLAPYAKNNSSHLEKLGGVALVLIVIVVIVSLLIFFDIGLSSISLPNYMMLFVVAVSGGILLKTTLAIRGMEKHAMSVIYSLEQNRLDKARTSLAMIVKRDTRNLDKNHILSGVLESVSENTVDGVTGPLFYFAIFGLPGAFVYRAINTIDSMIGYKTNLFKNIGWFGANCDKILNYLPSRITSLVMVLGAMALGINWRNSYHILLRDGKKTESPNAGFPMAALAGALETRFEKLNHYALGEGNLELTPHHVKSAINLMKITSILFCTIVTIPIIVALSYLGWWLHA